MSNPRVTTTIVGRERNCTQCGSMYRAQRSTSLYCSTPCRQKAQRGTAAKVGPRQPSAVVKALQSVGYIGCIGPASVRSKEAANYALLVSNELAFEELSAHFDRKGWGSVSKDEFAEALRSDGVQAFYSRSPEATEQKQWRDRNRQRLNSQLRSS